MIKKIIYYIFLPFNKLIGGIKYRRRLKELKKQDPFIYD